jgi:hypothetical protein
VLGSILEGARFVEGTRGESADCTAIAKRVAEKFVCRLYNHNLTNVNEVRMKMFSKGKCSIDAVPPTQDSLSFHMQRSNHQSFIWKMALTNAHIPSPNGHGPHYLENLACAHVTSIRAKVVQGIGHLLLQNRMQSKSMWLSKR